jgi:hypothetical protein
MNNITEQELMWYQKVQMRITGGIYLNERIRDNSDIPRYLLKKKQESRYI